MGAREGQRYDPLALDPPDMEAAEAFTQRIVQFWDLITSAPVQDNVLIVGHGAWIGFLLKHLAEVRKYRIASSSNDGAVVVNGTPRPWYIANASLQTVEVNKEGGCILRWGDVRHLAGSVEILKTNVDAEVAQAKA